MVVNIGTKTIPPGQTHVFDSTGGVLKRVYFCVIADVTSDTSIPDLQLSFTDNFTNYFIFTLNYPKFIMQSDKGTYQGKIFLRNNGTLTSHTFTYVEILQP